MKTLNKTVQTDPVSEFSDPGRVRRFKQVMEHYPSRMGLFRRVYHGQASPGSASRRSAWNATAGRRPRFANAATGHVRFGGCGLIRSWGGRR